MTAPDLIPIETLFSTPEFSRAQISPDGRLVAYLAPWRAATAVRIGQLDRSGKGLMPAKIGGYVRPTLRGAAADAVRQRLQVKSDWTVRALSADLKAAGINVSHDTVWRFLRSEGKTFKKTLVASEQDRPKVARFRMRWKTHQHRVDPDRLVFIDETWVKTNMTRTCG